MMQYVAIHGQMLPSNSSLKGGLMAECTCVEGEHDDACFVFGADAS